jgi:hypothetical protein
MHIFGLKVQRSWKFRSKHLKIYDYLHKLLEQYTILNTLFFFLNYFKSNNKELIFYLDFRIFMQLNLSIQNALYT